MQDNTKGALFMMGSMAGFTCGDACMKLLGGHLPLSQTIFLRGLGVLAALIVLAAANGALRVRPSRRDMMLILGRAAGETAAAFLFLTAIQAMPLANATSIILALPLTVTLAAAVFLREPVGWRRWAAILVGFMGILLIVQPGAAGFSNASLFALAAVILITARDIFTRKLSREVPSLFVALVAALMIAVASGLASLRGPFVAVSFDAGLLLVAAMGAMVLAYTCSIRAMRVGEIGFIAPFRYSSLLWALGLGVLVFGEWPNALALLGAMIVVASGLFMFYRERQVRTS